MNAPTLFSRVEAFVTSDKQLYLDARKEAETLAKQHGLRVADMPTLINAITTNPEVRTAVRPLWIDTITAEYHGQRKGKSSYEVGHSVGSITTLEGLEQSLPERGYGFMNISPEEWGALGTGETIPRIPLTDARKGNVPKGQPYIIFIDIETDNPIILSPGQLSYDDFMRDDSVLMRTGSPEHQAALAKMLFGKKKDGGEERSTIGNYHRIHNRSFSPQAVGRLSYVDSDYGGLGGGFNYGGRFFGVGDGVATRTSAEGARKRQSS